MFTAVFAAIGQDGGLSPSVLKTPFGITIDSHVRRAYGYCIDCSKSERAEHEKVMTYTRGSQQGWITTPWIGSDTELGIII